MSLSQNPVVQKSLRRLRNLGLKTYVDEVSDNVVLVLIDKASVVDAVLRLIRKSITYQNSIATVDNERGMIAVWFWKGEKPKFISDLVLR